MRLPVMLGILALATPLLLQSGCAGVCTTVGYGYDGDVELVFANEVPDDAAVLACFGEGCEPAAITAENGRWLVPQAEPFLDEQASPLGEATLRVVVEAGGATVHDEAHDIPIVTERSGWFGECPGPWRYGAVEI